MSALDFSQAGLISGLSSNAASSGEDALSGLSTDQFLDIVLQELRSQDPLEPNDTSAMLDQLATIWSIESDSDMMERLERVVSQGELASASGLIGATVGGLNELGQRVSGVVRAVSVTAEGPVLRLESGERVPMSSVDEFLGEPAESSNGPDGEGDAA